jgi:hypothetical protein
MGDRQVAGGERKVAEDEDEDELETERGNEERGTVWGWGFQSKIPRSPQIPPRFQK